MMRKFFFAAVLLTSSVAVFFSDTTAVHDWTYSHFPDDENAEWFGYLHRDGRISSTLKGNLWKGPFQMPRMQLVSW